MAARALAAARGRAAERERELAEVIGGALSDGLDREQAHALLVLAGVPDIAVP